MVNGDRRNGREFNIGHDSGRINDKYGLETSGFN